MTKLTKTQTTRVTDIKTGIAVAQKTFATKTPTLEMIFGCHDSMFVHDDPEMQAKVAAALEVAGGIAVDDFKLERVPEAVFGVFERVFEELVPEDDGNDYEN